ncbi:MAG: branched-chain amino acid ABC transporter substrate-binding protein [Bdellovibrionota bacterium]
MRHLLAKFLTTSILGVAIVAPAYADKAKEIKIGIAGPHSGAYAAFGEQLWRGTKKAADDINKAGGIDGIKIKLVKADDACEPKQAVSVANRLVDLDKVQAVVGHFCSSSTIPSSNVYDEAGVLMITPASTNPKVTERKMQTILRTCGRDDQQGVVAANYIVNQLKAKKVVVVHDKDTYGRGLADAMMAQLHKLGKKEVLYEGLTRGEKDFNALVTKIKSTKADVVYFGGLHTEAGPLLRQMREQGLKAKFVSGDGIASTDFVTTAGGNKFVDGAFMTFGADPRKLPYGKKVVEEFRKEKYEPESYTLYAYATIQAIAAAVKGTGGKTDGVALAKWLKAHTVPTVMGEKAWDDKGDLKVSDYVMYKWSPNGKYSEVSALSGKKI